MSTKPTGKHNNTQQLRRKARQRALQALYQWELNPDSVSAVVRQFEDTQDMQNTDSVYFAELFKECVARSEALDTTLAAYLDIPVDQLDPIERSILRLSSYELQQRMEIPYRVIINEAVDLAKKFGAEQGHKFINGVLDKAVKDWRPHER